MINLNDVEQEIKNDTTRIGEKAPKIRTLSDVVNSSNFTANDFNEDFNKLVPEFESDLNVRLRAGFDRGIQDLKNIPEQLEIYGGQALMSIGGFIDSGETVSMGRELIKSAFGELQADEKKYWESAIELSDKDKESFGYGLGQGIANYGAMLAVGYVSPIAGIGLGTALEVGQKAEEKIGYHIEETGDSELNKYTSQKAQKDTLYTTIYGVGSAIIEKKFGLGEQLKMVKMPITSKLKHVVKTMVSEGGTETLQELFATGLDWRGGYIDSSKLPERFMGALKEGAIGAVLGGGMGVASAINHRSQAKAILRDQLKNTVPEKDLDNVVDGIYESANDSMISVVAQELIQSESLRNKHGALYNQILQEINKQIEDVGAFSQYTEAQKSQYAVTTAKMFADQVLGEANKRGVVIDEVVKASEIVYKDGKLYLQGASKKTKLKRLKEKTPSLLQFIRSKGGVIDEGGELKMMDASKQYIGLVNKNGVDLDTMGEALWEAGYFTERPTVAELLDLIDSELRGTKHYPLGYVEQKGVSQAENEAMLDNAISEYAEVMEYDISKMSFEEKQQIYEQMQRNLFASEEPIVEGEEVVEDFGFTDNEFFQVADDKNLVAVHSISASSLDKAIDFGGFPVPSIAIINKNQEFHFDEQPITLVGNKEMIDPYDERNEVYNRDIWSKTFPLKTYKTPTVAKEKKFKEKIGEYFKKTVSENSLGSFLYTAQRGNPTSALGEFMNSSGAIMYYLENVKKEHVELPKKDKSSDYLFNMDEQLASEIKDLDASENKEEISEAVKRMIDREVERKKQKLDPNNKLHKKMLEVYKETRLERDFDNNGLIYFGVADSLVNNARKYYHFKGKEVLDHYDVNKFLREKIEDDSSYEDWAIKFFEDELVGEPMVEIGNKLKPFTLDNVVEAMISGATVATQESVFFGSGKIIASGAKKLESISDIREESKKLVTKEQSRENMKEIEEQISTFTGNFMDTDDFSNNMSRKDASGEALAQIVKNKNITKESLRKALNKHLVEKKNYPDDVLSYGVTLANNIKEMSRYYFEAKPQRAVSLQEFSGAIIPTSSEFDAIANKVESNGLKVIRSDNQIEAIRQLDNVFFQITNLPKQEKKIKGSFDALTKSIKITSEADFSTYQHEFAHFWLDNIWNYANSGVASEGYKKQFEGIKKWLGVKGNYLTREQHEKFARAYEKYLHKGTYANSPMGNVFGEYENFIREVYDSIAEIDTRAGKKYKAIPKVVYDFFNSMTSGTLPFYGDIEEPEKEVKKEVKEVKEFVAEETKILEENRANYTLKPVQTDTKTGYLTAYEKMTGQQVEAGAVNLKEDYEKAQRFVAENQEQAKRIVEGLEQAPEGMLKNNIYNAYNELQKKLGNTQNRVTSMLNQAMELRRMGQEIVSQKIAYADDTSPLYWIRTVQQNKVEALADASGLKVSELSEKINSSIKAGIKEGKSAKDIAKELREELGVTELFQEEVYPTEDTDIKSYNYIYKYVNEQLGLGMSMEEAETITRKADDMLASLENSMAKNGNPSVDFFVKQKDLENYANSLAPSSNARVIVSVVGRGNLLTSIKSPLTNIISNFFVGAYRGAVRRVNLGVANSIVSPELIKENKMYSWEIFRKTGYNVNNITPETPRNTILGEKLTHSEGEGNIRKLGRLYEEYIYKWSLGAGDVLFKDYAFTDYVALKATKLANGDVNKANALFKDASLIDPQTDEGKQIRQEAIDESLIATFQNKGAISEGALKARASIDFGVGFGEIIAPFVKTPANIVSMGLKAGFGGVRAIASEIKRDIKAGKILKPTQENIDLVVQNGLGLLLASMLINAIDDDDYMPPYALATSKDKQLAKELNIPFNAVKIGNTWVSLDYLGALASPLVGLLQARREEGFLNNIYGYSKSAGVQALSIPAFGNISDLFEKVQNLVRKSGDEVMSETGQDLLEQAYARVVPSIVSDVAKALDPYERETQGNEFITKIPVLRETAPKKVSVTSGVAEELGSPIYDLLFGSRVKEQVTNDVADELQRLNNVGYGVGLTTVTRSGLLSELDDDTKQKVREDFAEEYSKQVKRLIKTSRYKRLSDEDKMESVNKIRRSIIERLKKRYLKKRKK